MMRPRSRRVDGTADDHKVGTAVIIEIDKAGAPLHRSSFAGKSGGNGYVREEALALVVIEAGHFVGEIRLDDIEEPVAVVVHGVRAHSTLSPSVRIVSRSGEHTALAKSSIAVIHEEQAGRRIVGDVDIRPAIIVIVTDTGRETKGELSFTDSRRFRYFRKSAVRVISIQEITRPLPSPATPELRRHPPTHH